MAGPHGRDGPGGGVLSLVVGAGRGGEDDRTGGGLIGAGDGLAVFVGRQLWLGARFLAGKILGIQILAVGGCCAVGAGTALGTLLGVVGGGRPRGRTVTNHAGH